MDLFADPVLLSRLQFALTASYHFIFVPISIGIGLIMAIFVTKAFRSKLPEDEALSRMWVKIFTATFAIGVATGITMEFSFGTNWADYDASSAISSARRLPPRLCSPSSSSRSSSACCCSAGRRSAPVLRRFVVAGVVRLLPLGPVDSHRQLLDADSCRRRAVRRRQQGHHHRLLRRRVQPFAYLPLRPHRGGAAHHGRFRGHGGRRMVHDQEAPRAGCHENDARRRRRRHPRHLRHAGDRSCFRRRGFRGAAHQARHDGGHYDSEVPPLYAFGWVDEESQEVLAPFAIPGGTSFLATGTWDTEYPGLNELAQTDKYGDIVVEDMPVELRLPVLSPHGGDVRRHFPAPCSSRFCSPAKRAASRT